MTDPYTCWMICDSSRNRIVLIPEQLTVLIADALYAVVEDETSGPCDYLKRPISSLTQVTLFLDINEYAIVEMKDHLFLNRYPFNNESTALQTGLQLSDPSGTSSPHIFQLE